MYIKRKCKDKANIGAGQEVGMGLGTGAGMGSGHHGGELRLV